MSSINGEIDLEGLRIHKTLPRWKVADLGLVKDLELDQIASKIVLIFPPLPRPSHCDCLGHEPGHL